MIPALNIPATAVRLVTVTGRTFSLTVPTKKRSFFVALIPPTSSKGTDSSPRDLPPSVMRYWGGLLGPPGMTAGARVTLNRVLGRPYERDTYELLTMPKEFRSGDVTQGLSVPVQSVATLYPYSGTLREQDGTSLGAITVALWDSRDGQQSTGTYADFNGEAPPEFSSMLDHNRSLLIDGVRYRITSELMDHEGPRVKFTARLSNA